MLVSKPGSLQNWITFAMASFMAKDYKATLGCVTSMVRFDSEKSTLKPNEKSALRILQVQCLMKMGENAAAYKGLTENKSLILDQIKFYELKGEINLLLGKMEESKESYERLLEFNSFNFETYYRLIETNGVFLPADRVSLARHELSE